MSILTSNVVDSNMLIRCLVLSQEHFMSSRFFTGKILCTVFISLQNYFVKLSLFAIFLQDQCYAYNLLAPCMPCICLRWTKNRLELFLLLGNSFELIFLFGSIFDLQIFPLRLVSLVLLSITGSK